jgi:hypothetical protein
MVNKYKHEEIVLKKLNKIDSELQEIKAGIRRCDDHHTFVIRMYFAIKPNFMKFISYFNYRSDLQEEENLYIKNKEIMENRV